MSRSVYILDARIIGNIAGGIETRNYQDTRKIKLIVQEFEKEISEEILEQAEKAIEEMIEAGFNVDQVQKLLKRAKDKLADFENKEAYDLNKKILDLKEKAFRVDDLIDRLKEALENPRKTSLITGEVVRTVVNQKGEEVPVTAVLTGKAILFESSSVEEVLNMAITAFQRGDYNTTEDRAKSAQILLLLERRGSFTLFLYLYWYFVLIGIIILSIGGILGYKQYRKFSIKRKIENINKEEENIQKLRIENQKNYYTKKISATEHDRIETQNNQRISKLRKQRLELRNKRIKMLKPKKVIGELEKEKIEVEQEIKDIQTKFYKNRTIPDSVYKSQFEILNERLAEIEGEKTTLQLLEEKRKIEKTKDTEKQQVKKLEIEIKTIKKQEGKSGEGKIKRLRQKIQKIQKKVTGKIRGKKIKKR